MNSVAIPPKSSTGLMRFLRPRERSAWRNFLIALIVLSVAMASALVSAAASQQGRVALAAVTTVIALALAAWVAITIVPSMAKRTSLRWIAYQIDYRLTREGIIYLGAVFILVLAAVNTGNNLLFLVLACSLAGILISGVLSRVVLTGISLKLGLPEHIFAEQPILAELDLRNEKPFWPSFSLRVIGEPAKGKKEAEEENGILTRPVFFPYLARNGSVTQKVELRFARRGVYRQDTFGIRTRFPFGFFEKTRRVTSDISITVYPPVEPTDQFYEVLPLLSGEIASYFRGRGHELHSLRAYQPTDSARFVDWKVSAKSGHLMVREFAREDERRLMLVLDPFIGPSGFAAGGPAEYAAKYKEQFERAVSLAACIAWHFNELGSVLQFRTHTFSTPLAPAGEIVYSALRALAIIEPESSSRGGAFLDSLAAETEIFKIILTARPQRTIPTSLWSSSYFVFFDQL